MSLDYLTILFIIALLSIIQSLFGMGILVFGTPTLLLLGYDFVTILGYLLPASFAISLLQVLTVGVSRVPISRYLYLLCLPGIGIGLFLSEVGPIASWTNALIGGALLFSSLIRLWPFSRKLLTEVLKSHSPLYHFLMGIIHGLTNLGGAFLAILASGTHTGKEAIRYTTAHYYLAFSFIQMLVLATVMNHYDVIMSNLPSAAISAMIYLLIGKRIFIRFNDASYNFALTMFMAAYGGIIFLR